VSNIDDLPDDVAAEIAAVDVPDETMLAALGNALAKLRDEAVQARLNSGIEEVWRQAEEAYVGMDDANRHEFGKARWAKPLTMTGPVETSDRSNRGADARSNVFIRLTSRYVDAGAAKLGEILLPPDDKAFSIKPTPIPELVAQKKNLAPVMLANGMPAMRDPTPDELEPGQLPSQAPGVQLTYADLAKEKLEKADEAATAAEKRIYDWMVESQYTGQMRKVIFDSARAGVGVVKSPFPDEKRARAMRRNESGQVELTILSKIQPSTRWVSFWNVYPDPACGENIQDGDYCFEKDGISERKLRKLARLPGYIKSAIDRVIVEGPDKCRVNDPGNPIQDANRHQYTIWYFHGAIKREEFLSATRKDPSQAAGLKREQEMVHCVATMVNDSVVRVVLNPLEASGEHPYHAIPWKRRPGHWAGVGISEQVAVPQRIINAATRAMLDNAGKSAGSIIAIDRKMLQPADGRWTLGRDKIFYTSPDAALEDIRKAITCFEIPNQTDKLMAIINYAFRLAEESTSIPLITQGHSGSTTPDTFGAAQLQNNNANQLLRDIGYQFDEFGTEPIVRQHYEWLLLDPDVPDEEKGDFQIDAHGSIALVERAIQDQTILQMGAMVVNPAFGINPEKWFEQLAKSKRLNPKEFRYTEAEKEKMAQKQPPPAPAVQAAQVRAASAEKIAAAELQADTQARQESLAMERELAMLKYANDRGLTLEQVKAQLAEAAMKINLQRELSQDARIVDLHKHHTSQAMKPPVEPAGRAPAGEAFAA